jgi:hypothetical protein
VASTLLTDRSFFIEFQGYLSNHAKHAIIALDRLHAPESRVQEYWDTYTSVTPYGLSLKAVDSWLDIRNDSSKNNRDWFHSLRGKKQQWQEQCVYLEQELANTFHGDKTMRPNCSVAWLVG